MRCRVTQLTLDLQQNQYIFLPYELARRHSDMSCEFDRDRIDQIIILSGLALFIALTILVPA